MRSFVLLKQRKEERDIEWKGDLPHVFMDD